MKLRQGSRPVWTGNGSVIRRPMRNPLRYMVHFLKTKPLGAGGAVVAVTVVIVAIFAPWIATTDPHEVQVARINIPPSLDAWFGGDRLGRDVFSRLVFGARISIYVGLLSSLIGTTLGVALGVVSAYVGGKLDLGLQRVVDAMIAFPGIILALAIMASLGASINNVVIALSIAYIPSAIRIIRSQALVIKEMDYILSARAVGAGSLRIMFRHIFPNCLSIYIVITTFHLGGAIIAEAGLSFLGIGAPPHEPAWGGMLSDASRQYISVAPWLPVFPGAAIIVVVLAWNLLGDALRDVLDPRLRGVRSPA